MPATRKINVLLIDDHRIVREGIRSSLSDYAFITIVGEGADGNAALQKIAELSPDVVLMDLNMPRMSGLEATRIARTKFPKTKIIALTMHDNHEYVSQILRSGAKGYVLKDTSPEELVQAIRSVANGDAFFSPTISRLLLDEYTRAPEEQTASTGLSKREEQVLKYISYGKTNKEIAQELNISIRTVETYRARLMRKVKARNGADLARYALVKNVVR